MTDRAVISDTPAEGTTVPESSLPPVARAAISLIPLWVALIALPFFLATDLPIAAWLIATGAWAFNRALTVLIVSLVSNVTQIIAVAVAGFSMIARAWIVVLVIFWVGADVKVGTAHIGLDRQDIALPALLLFVVLITFDIGLRAMHELLRLKIGTTQREDAR